MLARHDRSLLPQGEVSSSDGRQILDHARQSLAVRHRSAQVPEGCLAPRDRTCLSDPPPR